MKRITLTVICILILALTPVLAAAEGPDTTFRGARGYALIVAGWYEDGTPHGNLYWHATRGFYDILRERYGYSDGNIYWLVHKDKHGDERVDGFSTLAEIEQVCKELEQRVRPQDPVVFFFVGHGGEHHFAASDAALRTHVLDHWARNIQSEHQLWTFSQCSSGNFPRVCARPGRTVFSSCRADEANAMPWAEAVRDALGFASGADENSDGLVTFGEAYNFARRRQISHYGSEAKLKEHSQICDDGCGEPSTGALPNGRHGATALREVLGQEFGQVVTWTGKASDGQRMTYPRTFTGKAVVVCAAHKNGRPVAACAIDNTETGFTLGLQDHHGQRTTDADVCYVAFLPSEQNRIQARCHYINSARKTVRFDREFDALPVVVCNAQRRGEALLAGVTDFDTRSFTVEVSDIEGKPVDGAWLLWLAAVPGVERPNLQVGGGYLANYPHSGLRKIFDPETSLSNVIVASAAWPGHGLRATVAPAGQNWVDMKVYMPGGDYSARAWHAHYLSFRTAESGILQPVAPIRIAPIAVPRP